MMCMLLNVSAYFDDFSDGNCYDGNWSGDGINCASFYMKGIGEDITASFPFDYSLQLNNTLYFNFDLINTDNSFVLYFAYSGNPQELTFTFDGTYLTIARSGYGQIGSLCSVDATQHNIAIEINSTGYIRTYIDGLPCADGQDDWHTANPEVYDDTLLLRGVNVNEIIDNFYMDYSPLCFPNWLCDGYGSCMQNNTQNCIAVADDNECGQTYSGDYSEFTPQVCSYIPPVENVGVNPATSLIYIISFMAVGILLLMFRFYSLRTGNVSMVQFVIEAMVIVIGVVIASAILTG